MACQEIAPCWDKTKSNVKAQTASSAKEPSWSSDASDVSEPRRGNTEHTSGLPASAIGCLCCISLICSRLYPAGKSEGGIGQCILYVVLLPRSTGADSTRNARRKEQGSTKRLRQPHSCNRAKKGPTTGASSSYAKGGDSKKRSTISRRSSSSALDHRTSTSIDLSLHTCLLALHICKHALHAGVDPRTALQVVVAVDKVMTVEVLLTEAALPHDTSKRGSSNLVDRAPHRPSA